MKARHLIMGFLLLLAPFGGNAQEAGGKRVSISGDKLSAHVTNAPLFDVLKEIGDGTGMEVKVDPEVNKNVTVSFENVPIDRGIARLIHPLDFVIKWKRIRGEDAQRDTITSVEIFKKGEREKARQVLSPAPASGRPREEQRVQRREEEKEAVPDLRSTRSSRRKSQPSQSLTSSVKDVKKDGSGGARAYSVSSGSVSLRKYNVIPDDASYDELTP